MRYSLLSFTLVLSCLACNNSTKNDKNLQQETDPQPDTLCYQFSNNKDLVSMQLFILGDNVNGKLEYAFFEKDKNSGTLVGNFHGDTLVADYTFKSEGIFSTRQVIFLRKGNEMIEGYGPMADQDGKMIFSRPDSIRFNENTPLYNIDCQ
ncbi:hypothetical protein COR50_13105 [Chitinophaga caeni]|uniref:Uncharacterized protein n=1 Tax=Chitinophaga caeni TaxID=2029983 RepID=A0A291QVH0_9BACT|nr:hypothetical protein [Chitinophaga caeni]ATL48029.1 hypothetical protein COR50_13105 [Chitinophaga caeni]